MKTLWEISTISVYDRAAEDNYAVRSILAEGWEPFAVTMQESTKIVFFKRKKEPENEG
jgi:hypothetical protein